MLLVFTGTCDFDGGDLCLWSNSQSDTFDWVVIDGNTSTTNTGPDEDHTNSSIHRGKPTQDISDI